MAKIQAAIHPDDDYHYQKMGLTRNKIELWEDGKVTESVTEESAVWELMYFGKAGADKK